MLIEIKNRFTAKVIFSAEADSIKTCLQMAVKAGRDLSEVDLSGADLSGVNLYKVNLSKADLSGADLSAADLSEADLCEADLCEADLCGTNLFEVNLYKADLYKANLCMTNLYRADLCGAKNIIYLQWHGFNFYIQSTMSKIGCEYRTNKEWLTMAKKEAVKLGIDGDYYQEYRAILRLGIKLLKEKTHKNPSMKKGRTRADKVL